MWAGLADASLSWVTLACPALQSKHLSSSLVQSGQLTWSLAASSPKRGRMGNATSPREIQVQTLQNQDAIGLHTSINQSS